MSVFSLSRKDSYEDIPIGIFSTLDKAITFATTQLLSHFSRVDVSPIFVVQAYLMNSDLVTNTYVIIWDTLVSFRGPTRTYSAAFWHHIYPYLPMLHEQTFFACCDLPGRVHLSHAEYCPFHGNYERKNTLLYRNFHYHGKIPDMVPRPTSSILGGEVLLDLGLAARL